MILADRAHLEAKIRKLTIDVRTKELQFFRMNFRVMAQQATFICGLAFACLYAKPTYRGGDHPVENGWRDPAAYPEVRRHGSIAPRPCTP